LEQSIGTLDEAPEELSSLPDPSEEEVGGTELLSSLDSGANAEDDEVAEELSKLRLDKEETPKGHGT
jgi:hypothetical protein